MGGEMSWDLHVGMISERYKRESIAHDRTVAHFVKDVSGWCLVTGQLPNGGPATVKLFMDLWNKKQ
jgi:hypothetical protein